MKKNDLRGIIVTVILLVVFNVLSFVIPFVHTVGFWLGYAFGMLAILIQIPLLYLAFRKGDSPRSRFYGFPVAQVGIVYLLVQLVLSIVGMSLGTWTPAWMLAIVYVVVLSVAAIGFVAVDAMRDEVERQDELLEKDVASMRNIQSRANALLSLCDDKGRDTLQKLIEEIRYSDPVSNAATAELEAQLDMLLNDLQTVLTNSDSGKLEQLCKKAMIMLTERNRLCKLNKGK